MIPTPPNTAEPYHHSDCDKAIIDGQLDKACQECRDHMFKPPSVEAKQPAPAELRDYVHDMFLMVWRDATAGLGAEKHVVCNSATELVLKRLTTELERAVREAMIDALQNLASDPSLPPDCPSSCKQSHWHHVAHGNITYHIKQLQQPEGEKHGEFEIHKGA